MEDFPFALEPLDPTLHLKANKLLVTRGGAELNVLSFLYKNIFGTIKICTYAHMHAFGNMFSQAYFKKSFTLFSPWIFWVKSQEQLPNSMITLVMVHIANKIWKVLTDRNGKDSLDTGFFEVHIREFISRSYSKLLHSSFLLIFCV